MEAWLQRGLDAQVLGGGEGESLVLGAAPFAERRLQRLAGSGACARRERKREPMTVPSTAEASSLQDVVRFRSSDFSQASETEDGAGGGVGGVLFSRVWAMPNADTFSVKPIGDFVRRYLKGASISGWPGWSCNPIVFTYDTFVIGRLSKYLFGIME